MDICKLRKDVWSVFENKRNRVVLPNTPDAVARYWNGRYCFCLKTDRYDEYVEEFSSCRLELEDMDDGRYLIFSTDELSDAFVDMAFGSLLVLDNPERRREIASNPEIFYDEIAHMLGNSFTENRVASKIAELYVYLKLRENGIKAVFGGFEKKSLHDINCGEYVIEVKSTQKHHEWPVTTNLEQMKSRTDGADLYLCLVRLEPTEAYGDKVYSIDKLVKSLGEYSGTDSLPNMPRNSSVRGKRFLVQEVRILQVTQSFPRPYLEGNGAKLTNYTLNLDPDALGAQSYEDFLKQRGTQDYPLEDDPNDIEHDDGSESTSTDLGGDSVECYDGSGAPGKCEVKSTEDLKKYGLEACGIGDIEAKGKFPCVGIGLREEGGKYRFIQLAKTGFAEALRFVANFMFLNHRDSVLAEARKSRKERQAKKLKDLAMSVEELGRDAEKTPVFWLGQKGEAPVVNLKLGAPDIARFIGALASIDNAYDPQQIVFYLKVTDLTEVDATQEVAATLPLCQKIELDNVGEDNCGEPSHVTFEEKSTCGSISSDETGSTLSNEYAVGDSPKIEEGVFIANEIDKSIRLLRKDAERGIPEAQYSLGLRYAEGRGVEPNMAEATKWLRKAATYDYKDAFRILRQFAEKNEPEAMFALGICYERGICVEESMSRAVEWWRKAAEHNQQEAANSLKRNADLGSSEARYELGILYENGKALEQNKEEAARLWHLAAREGHQEAFNHLNNASKSDDGGSQYAKYYLGRCFSEGRRIVPYDGQANSYDAEYTAPDYNTAAKLWWSAIEQGYGEKAFESLEKYANQSIHNNSYVLYYLGLCYANGRVVERDIKRAIGFWQQSIKKGCGKALDDLKILADAGTVEAQRQLGIIYADGDQGVGRNMDLAVQYFQRSAQQGDVDSMYILGCCYAAKDYVGNSMAKAADYWNDASNLGHRDAKYRLALCYCDGEGRDKDADRACELLRQAAELGNSEALTQLQAFEKQGTAAAKYAMGLLYADGKIVERDKCRAAKLLFESATGGFADAISSLKEFAENGSVDAWYYLGRCYAEGAGIGQDLVEAVKCWREAAQGNNPDAQYRLGCCLADGTGVPVNMQEAASWWDEATKREHLEAEYRLGRCYAEGTGVDKNLSRAAEFLTDAAKRGHAGAIECLIKYDDADRLDAEHICSLGEVFEKGRGIEKDCEKAVSYYKKAAKKGCAEAQYRLGLCFAKGYGVEKDVNRAIMWCLHAADAGYEPAKIWINRTKFH